MKKIITIIIVTLYMLPLITDAAISRSSFSSSRSSISRSSSSSYKSSSYSSSKSTPTRSSITTSTKPITKSKHTTQTTTYSRQTTIISTPNYRWVWNYDNWFGSPFLMSLWWSVVWSIAGNMIYDALTPDQSLWQMINDGKVQYQEILNSSWSVVWYKPVGQLQTNTSWQTNDTKEEDHTVAWLVFFGVMILWWMFIFSSFNNRY